jgi:hypothetical protein
MKLDIYLFDKIIFCVGKVQISLNRNKYDKITDLTETEVKIFSQNGEDGIIDYLLHRLKLDKKNFVEIGVGNYRESNTRFLYNRYYPKGLIVDHVDDMEKKIKPFVNFWKGDLRISNKQINSENILDILKNSCDYEIDLFSIDIDSIDYWIIDKLEKNISKIFVAEYNSVFGSLLEVTVPNLDNFDRKEYHYSHLCYGVSLKGLINIMTKKNFYFIGTNSVRNNAFFVSNDYPKEEYFKNLKIEDLSYYVDSNIRESRNKMGNLNYLSGKKKIKEIQDCEVIDISSDINKRVKIKDIIKISS